MMTEVIFYLSLLSLFVSSPITAHPNDSPTRLAPRNQFLPGYPADPSQEPIAPNTAPVSYNIAVLTPQIISMRADSQAIIVAAVAIPICVLALGFCLYRRRRKFAQTTQIIRYQADGAIFVDAEDAPASAAAATEAATVVPERRSRRVWRAEPALNGVPAYTSEAATGELSLGIGRKRSTEEYEMVRVESMMERRASSGTMLEGEIEGDEVDEVEVAPQAPVSDPLPPYVPPPPPVVVASHARATSLESTRGMAGSPSR